MSGAHSETSVARIFCSERTIFLRTILHLCKNKDGHADRALLDMFWDKINDDSKSNENLL